MKFFIVSFLVAVSISQCFCSPLQGQLTENQQGLTENLDALRIKKAAKSAYGAPAPSYAPPPCPSNYLFSCGPHLQPVPCSQGGYQGAYSENVPQYAAPQYAAPQYIVPQHYAFPHFAVPVITEV